MQESATQIEEQWKAHMFALHLSISYLQSWDMRPGVRGVVPSTFFCRYILCVAWVFALHKTSEMPFRLGFLQVGEGAASALVSDSVVCVRLCPLYCEQMVQYRPLVSVLSKRTGFEWLHHEFRLGSRKASFLLRHFDQKYQHVPACALIWGRALGKDLSKSDVLVV